MNSADLARLALAKRAFQATQPADAEVQTGVRRARLSLDRPKKRRAWFSKGLVFVVLAVGSLAYAKPQAIGELVEKVLPHQPTDAGKGVARGGALPPVEAALKLDGTAPMRGRPATNSASPNPSPSPDSASALVETTNEPVEAPLKAEAPHPGKTPALAVDGSARQAEASTPKKAAAERSARALAAAQPAAPTSEPEAAASSNPVSDWGRVGQALARGDDTQALAALNGLSESDDPRTRDKADLGRAQLLMAHGDPDKACALARALTHRRAGGRIERQAQLLLKSCTR